MLGHDQMRQHGLCRQFDRFRRLERDHLADDPVRPERFEKIELARSRSLRPPVGQIDDLARLMPLDGRMRRIDETGHAFGQPVIAACLPAGIVHALLHHHPFSVVGDDETVQIEVEPVLHGGTIHFRHQPAGTGQRIAIEPGALADRHQLARCLARLLPAPAADMNAELMRHRRQPAFQGADDAGGNAGGMPVHAHDGAEGLEPEGMRDATEKFVAPVMNDDRLGNDGAEPGHAFAEPPGNPAAMKRKIGAASTLSHGLL